MPNSDIFIKRIIFLSLLLLFFAYTYSVYTFNGAGDISENNRAQKGKKLFQDYNCTACHQLYGLGGYMGPDLTNVISHPLKGPKYTETFIQSGTLRMPNFHLSDLEVQCLVEYLKEVDKTGLSPVTNFTIEANGDVNYNQ